ncbi:uncharacterized protein LOC106173353 [Lingula anatina]|uniref:Uncharacterized protein LOC106173353 n=1 Tax=Lingula anatina TaxID=7574 RepID=A0A1S3JHS5_LINAN|nr:uncharacterized protein LOC106173353 [Lingula anatina]|eukprot:XP_013409918.1 uncharacterized protein LOC106173353 [Lingula anatina]
MFSGTLSACRAPRSRLLTFQNKVRELSPPPKQPTPKPKEDIAQKWKQRFNNPKFKAMVAMQKMYKNKADAQTAQQEADADYEKENEAAIMIQKSFRGHKVRKELEKNINDDLEEDIALEY